MGKPQTQELRLNPYEVFFRPQQTLQIIPSFPFTVAGGEVEEEGTNQEGWFTKG